MLIVGTLMLELKMSTFTEDVNNEVNNFQILISNIKKLSTIT